MFALRTCDVVFAAAVHTTLPAPVPLEFCSVIQAAPLVADQLQPSAAVTSMLPFPPPAPTALADGEADTLHDTPA